MSLDCAVELGFLTPKLRCCRGLDFLRVGFHGTAGTCAAKRLHVVHDLAASSGRGFTIQTKQVLQKKQVLQRREAALSCVLPVLAAAFPYCCVVTREESKR